MFKKSAFVFVILSLNFVFFSFVSAQVAPQNLFGVDANTVALWRFNDLSANVVTDETGINNGTAIGTSVVDGKFGKARYFNGQSDYIVVPHSPSLTNFSQITIEAWIYPTGFDLGCWANGEYIAGKGADSQSGNNQAYRLWIFRNQEGWCGSANNFTKLKFNITFADIGTESSWHTPDNWYYVVATYDGNYVRLYVNGVMEGISTYATNLTVNTTEPLYVNRHTWEGGASSQRMQGQIDEIRISKVARSAGEISYYYNLATKPQEFWAEVQNAPTGKLELRQTAGSQNKPADDIIKIIPNSWVVKVASTTDENGNNIDIDGYRWCRVEDATDGTIGWIAAISLSDGTVYLNYSVDNQSALEQKAAVQFDTIDERKSVIFEAVNNYYAKDNIDNSLYGGGGGRDSKNNFSKFIIGSEFPKELILAVAAEESGGHEFNNEVCADVFDGGIGIMQITSPNSKGLGSGLDINSKRNDCKGEEWVGRFSKYYSNALQGIYANIKDGFRILQDKYDQTLRLMANPRIIAPCPLTIDGVNLTCLDIQKSLTVWGYNGISKNKNGQYGDYLGNVAVKLRNLNNYFTGIINDVNKIAIETLSYKLETVNNNKTLVKLNSPGELQIIDSQGQKTGVFDNIIKEEIPFSIYDANTKGAAIFFQNDSYIYNVIGTASGEYGLDIENAQHGNFSGFSAVNLPITDGEVHQYQIDWDALNRGERGVKLNIDYEGDGIIDQIINSDAELHDIEPPQITADVLDEYLLNSQLQIKFNATDKVSGIASVEALLNDVAVNNNQIVVLTKPGLNTLKIIATDNDGNVSTLIKNFNVIYKFSDFLPPIKNNNNGYKLNQTLPIKFQLTDINNNYISTASTQLFIKENYIGVFRYDNIDNQYIYNLSTKNLSVGTHQFKIVLDDGKDYQFSISLR